MNFTRRTALVGIAGAGILPFTPGGTKNMSLLIRNASPSDIPAIVALQLADAKLRARLNPRLWALATNASERMIAALKTISEPYTGATRHHWIVAERGGTVVGVMHGMNIPTPGIYEERGGKYAGVIADDSHVPADTKIANALVKAVEDALLEADAGVLVATSPADWTARREFFSTAGYVPTTSYLLNAQPARLPKWDSSVRSATEADVDGIVKLSALHRSGLEQANPDFWKIHPDADRRFDAWMRISLGMKDRSMFVSGGDGQVDGFVIAQPASLLHLTAAHDSSKLGLIDDFCALAFNAPEMARDGGGEPSSLLSAAESSFRARGLDAALAISPVRMAEKVKVLNAAGYQAVNLWMAKRM